MAEEGEQATVAVARGPRKCPQVMKVGTTILSVNIRMNSAGDSHCYHCGEQDDLA